MRMGDWFRLPLRDWSLLPDDLLILIIDQIRSVEDLIKFSRVCRSWRSIAVRQFSIRRFQLPWLMLAENHNAETRRFFSIHSNRDFNVMLPNMQGRRSWGSQSGWLLVLEFDRQFYLFNPLTRVRLDLPPKPIFEGEMDHDDRNNRGASVPGFVRKAIVLKDGSMPSTSQERDPLMVVVMGNLSGNLAFARPGGRNWIQVKTPFGRIVSAAWFDSRLFVILENATLLCCERNEHGRFEAKQFVSELNHEKIWDNLSLLESFGDLLLVVRCFGENSRHWYRTEYFDIYKLDFETKDWTELDDLGDCALFIDAENSAMALRASEVENCKRNCIYFVEKYWNNWGRYWESHDMGIFNMVDRLIEPRCITDIDPWTSHLRNLRNPNPIWLMPSLC